MKLPVALFLIVLPTLAFAESPHDRMENCIIDQLNRKGSSPECPTAARIRNEIFQQACKAEIDAYFDDMRKQGDSPDRITATKRVTNQWYTDFINRNLPKIQEAAFCG